jgi:hypothetical protein
VAGGVGAQLRFDSRSHNGSDAAFVVGFHEVADRRDFRQGLSSGIVCPHVVDCFSRHHVSDGNAGPIGAWHILFAVRDGAAAAHKHRRPQYANQGQWTMPGPGVGKILNSDFLLEYQRQRLRPPAPRLFTSSIAIMTTPYIIRRLASGICITDSIEVSRLIISTPATVPK